MKKKILPKPSFKLKDIQEYRVPKHPAYAHHIDLFLDGNEGLEPPIELTQGLVETFAAKARRYPARLELEEALAKHLSQSELSVTSDQVLVTAGADEAIERVAKAFLDESRALLLPVPTFEMIEKYVRLAGSKTIEVPWTQVAFPTKAVISKKKNRRIHVVAIVSPNNPTGGWITSKDLDLICKSFPQSLIMVDAAYGEFSDEDLLPVVMQNKNAVMLRTFSKAYGLAGLRVGYVVGTSAVIEILRRAGAPYAVSSLSLAIAARALKTCDQPMKAFVSEVKRERQSLVQLLQGYGISPLPSQGNFVYGRFIKAHWLHDQLAGLGIAVRYFPKKNKKMNALRITCPGNPKHFRRLTQALEVALDPQCILFDLDGVIADVSKSYRQAILQTARLFGARATPADISAEKALGNANNDWLLTQRLLKRYGRDISFNQVKEKFEMLYQGQLKQKERLFISKKILTLWGKKIPLGIVTGRPSKDATDFLERFRISDCFRVVVCMEDAPLKPSPKPLQLALQRLGLQRGWYVGDTPDDMVAAREAGILPIGVLNTSDSKEQFKTILFENGAARVLDQLSQLEELL